MLEQLKDIICEYVEVEKKDISEDSRFMEDLGFNSYDFQAMVGEIEEAFDIEVVEREVVNVKTSATREIYQRAAGAIENRE